VLFVLELELVLLLPLDTMYQAELLYNVTITSAQLVLTQLHVLFPAVLVVPLVMFPLFVQ
jgi:hypothetical protein